MTTSRRRQLRRASRRTRWFSVKNANSENSEIGGGIGVGPEGYEGHVTFYIEVPDVGASLDQVEKLGGTRVMGPD